jgi:hypothetical protein
MSLLGTLFSKIFPSSHAANRGQAATQQAASQPAAAQQGAGTAAKQPPATPSANAPVVDVEQVLNDMASKSSQKLNWRTSIVDLMKLVGMDSSVEARKTLAQELKYTGDMNDSAAMNIWLHKQVMKKLAENGGKVPQDLLRH